MDEEIAKREAAVSDTAGLHPRQVAALEKLYELGAEPRGPDEKYSPDRRIRMWQLQYEGRTGGPQTNSGRRKSRAGADVANYVSDYLTKKIKKALKEGLTHDEIMVKLKTVDLAMKIEREEASLALREEQTDIDNADKEQLIALLIAAARDPETAPALEAAVIDLPESAITEVANDSEGGSSTVLEETGVDSGANGSDDSERIAREGTHRANPFTQVAHRGAAKRRRVA